MHGISTTDDWIPTTVTDFNYYSGATMQSSPEQATEANSGMAHLSPATPQPAAMSNNKNGSSSDDNQQQNNNIYYDAINNPSYREYLEYLDEVEQQPLDYDHLVQQPNNNNVQSQSQQQEATVLTSPLHLTPMNNHTQPKSVYQQRVDVVQGFIEQQQRQPSPVYTSVIQRASQQYPSASTNNAYIQQTEQQPRHYMPQVIGELPQQPQYHQHHHHYQQQTMQSTYNDATHQYQQQQQQPQQQQQQQFAAPTPPHAQASSYWDAGTTEQQQQQTIIDVRKQALVGVVLQRYPRLFERDYVERIGASGKLGPDQLANRGHELAAWYAVQSLSLSSMTEYLAMCRLVEPLPQELDALVTLDEHQQQQQQMQQMQQQVAVVAPLREINRPQQLYQEQTQLQQPQMQQQQQQQQPKKTRQKRKAKEPTTTPRQTKRQKLQQEQPPDLSFLQPQQPLEEEQQHQQQRRAYKRKSLVVDQEIVTLDSENKRPKPSKCRDREQAAKQREAANQRERERTHCLNQAFADVRGRLPTMPADKMSKIMTLRIALHYVEFMQHVLDFIDYRDESELATLPHSIRTALLEMRKEPRDEAHTNEKLWFGFRMWRLELGQVEGEEKKLALAAAQAATLCTSANTEGPIDPSAFTDCKELFSRFPKTVRAGPLTSRSGRSSTRTVQGWSFRNKALVPTFGSKVYFKIVKLDRELRISNELPKSAQDVRWASDTPVASVVYTIYTYITPIVEYKLKKSKHPILRSKYFINKDDYFIPIFVLETMQFKLTVLRLPSCMKKFIFQWCPLRHLDGREVQHSQSIGASAVQVHRHGARRHDQVRVAGQSAPGLVQLLHGPLRPPELLLDRRERGQGAREIQSHGEDAAALRSAAGEAGRLIPVLIGYNVPLWHYFILFYKIGLRKYTFE
ncbi:unnamed protein product [Trichogramma brassicae]|uniref:BHLH domain-containing protein n=1 Tax=Trichogramma brassicae TaxID=86971 RepID=A0A6H5IBQ0_9HYME|nr:unnamed protein product [Trichogramma brassicae]